MHAAMTREQIHGGVASKAVPPAQFPSSHAKLRCFAIEIVLFLFGFFFAISEEIFP